MIDPKLLESVILASREGVVIADFGLPDRPLIYVNPGFESMTGYSAEEVVGRNCRFLQGDDHDQPELEVLRTAVREERHCVVKLRNYRKDGTVFWNELSISPVRDDADRVTHYVGIQKDITERVEAQTQLLEKQRELERINHQLRELAIRDGLTGIHNRRYFDQSLDKAWDEGAELSVMLVDVDCFKQYNDHHGHQAGDEALKRIAGVIDAEARRDEDLAARYGGEEFVVLARRPARDAQGLAESVVQAVRKLGIRHDASQVREVITVSAGVAANDAAYASPRELIRAADAALYRAKDDGRDRACVSP
jgi:diguanylate cyclase (GGDEF)-like protein/PAS domain S-box-containing protein